MIVETFLRIDHMLQEFSSCSPSRGIYCCLNLTEILGERRSSLCDHVSAWKTNSDFGAPQKLVASSRG
jgi:hypothetical protein